MLAHRAHAELARFLLKKERRRTVVDQLAKRIRHAQILDDGLAPLVAGSVARLAATTEVERTTAYLVARHRDAVQRLVVGLVGLAALAAASTHKSLAKHAFKRRREKIRGDIHVHETRDGTCGVVGVEGREDEVPGKRRLNRDFGRLKVADLADHHHVWILTEERSQNFRECVADLRIDRHLHNAVDVVFDRLLGREELRVDLVDAAKDGVKRRGLARAGRPGHDEDAVRLLDVHRYLLVDVLGKPHVLKIERGRGLVENSHNDRLAMGCREARYAKVNWPSRDGKRNTSVLRDAALGDVQVRKNLDTRDDRWSHLDVRRLHLVKSAVDAVAYLEVVLKRLDVDVRRTVHDALVENEIYKADDCGRVRRVLHRSDVVDIRGGKTLVVAKPFAERLYHVGDGVVRIAVVLGNAVHHVLLARHDELHLLGESEEHFVCDAGVDDVKRRECNGRFVRGHWEDVVHAGRRGGNRLGDLGVDRHSAEIDGLGVLVGRDYAKKVILGKYLLVEDGLANSLSLGLRGIGELLGGDLIEIAVLNENLENRVVHLYAISSLSLATTESGSCDLVISSS